MEYQLELSFQQPEQPAIRGQPDDEAIRMIREFEALALRNDPRGYCLCTSEGKGSRVLGHLMRRYVPLLPAFYSLGLILGLNWALFLFSFKNRYNMFCSTER